MVKPATQKVPGVNIQHSLVQIRLSIALWCSVQLSDERICHGQFAASTQLLTVYRALRQTLGKYVRSHYHCTEAGMEGCVYTCLTRQCMRLSMLLVH